MNHLQAVEPKTEAAGQSRFDIYRIIHKALRNFMMDTLTAMGSMDCNDAAQTAQVLNQVRELAAVCRGHFSHENDFVHAAMEVRRPGSAAQVAAEHEHHAWAIGRLEALADAVDQAQGLARQENADELYRYLALFVAENLVHMNLEETENNAVLWATHTDAELLAIEHAIVASLSPQESMATMRWMLPAMNASERAAHMQGIRLHAPAPVFDAMMTIARTHLPSPEWSKLLQSLEVPVQAAA